VEEKHENTSRKNQKFREIRYFSKKNS